MSSCLDRLEFPQEAFLATMFRRWQIQRRFVRRFGKYVDFDSPKSSLEKTQYRKLYGNHAVFGFLADKYRVREYVTERVGAEILVPLLGAYERLTPEIFDDLPDQFAMKANHGCKWNRFVRDKSQLDRAETIQYFHKVLRRNYAHASGEQHYAFIPPLIVIEKLLVDQGESPSDYHFDCFNDSTGFSYSLAVSIPGGSRTTYFDDHWNAVDGNLTPQEIERLRAPQNFDRMVDIIRELSRGFDFLRIDLYNIDGAIYFGEITCTPSSGLRKIDKPIHEARRHDRWKLDCNNPWLYRRRAF